MQPGSIFTSVHCLIGSTLTGSATEYAEYDILSSVVSVRYEQISLLSAKN